MREFTDLDSLPPLGRRKLSDLRRWRDDALALSRRAHERVGLARNRLEDARQRLRILVEAPQARMKLAVDGDLMAYGGSKPDPLTADGPRVVELEREISRHEEELKHARELVEFRSAQFTEIGQLIQRLDRYLLALPPGPIPAYGVVVTHDRKGKLSDQIEYCRRRVRELRADAHRVASAPYPSTQVKEAIRAEIEKLAERGRPDLGRAIDLGTGEIKWPEAHVVLQATTSNGMAGIASGHVVDTVPLLAWLFRSQLIKALQREIGEIADDEAALTDEQRKEKLKEIAADLLATEREEELLIEMAEAQGSPIARRPDCDPRAVLSLDSNLPPPE